MPSDTRRPNLDFDLSRALYDPGQPHIVNRLALLEEWSIGFLTGRAAPAAQMPQVDCRLAGDQPAPGHAKPRAQPPIPGLSLADARNVGWEKAAVGRYDLDARQPRCNHFCIDAGFKPRSQRRQGNRER